MGLERAAGTREPIVGERYNIVAWFEQNSEPTLGICRKRPDRPILAADAKSCARKRHRIGKFRSGPDRSRASWLDRDDTLNPTRCSSIYLAESQACGRKQETDDSHHPKRQHDPSLSRIRSMGKLVLRRGFQISPSERFVIVKDVVTRGGRVQETIEIVRAHDGIVSAVGVIVDRSGKSKPDFGCSFVSLVEMTVENFPADNLPPDLAKIPAVKPGSK